MSKKLSVVLPILLHSRYLFKITHACINNLRMYTDYDVELIVIHNQSQYYHSDIKKMLKKGDIYIEHRDTNENSGKCINEGFKAASSDLLCILANDVLVHQDWLFYARQALDAGHDFVIPWMWKLGKDFYQEKVEESKGSYMVPTGFTDGGGNCCIFKRETYDMLGPLDENLIIHCDRDYNYRIKHLPRDKRISVVNHLKSFVTHLGSMTWIDANMSEEEKLKFFGWTMSEAHEHDHQYFEKKWNKLI